MPPAHVDSESQGFDLRLRLTTVGRAAWEAGLEPGETLSDLVRDGVGRELERRQAEAEKARRTR